MKTVRAQTLKSYSPSNYSNSFPGTSTGNTDTDFKNAVQSIKKHVKEIYNLAYKKIEEHQKKVDGIAKECESFISKRGLPGTIANALVARPAINMLKSLATLNPIQVVEQLNDNTIFSIYDILDNANLIPEGNKYLQTISNFYDWVQVLNGILPFIRKEETDPYHYIELTTDLIYALKELPIAEQIPSMDVLNVSLMSAYLFSKVGAPTARYLGDKRRGLKIFGFPLEKDQTKITDLFDKHFDNINKEINNAILNGKTKSFEILNDLGTKFPWVKTFQEKSNLTNNELYLMEHTRDLIIKKLKIYNIVSLNFKNLKDTNFKWTGIRFMTNWDQLDQNDKEFVNGLVERYKKTNL